MAEEVAALGRRVARRLLQAEACATRPRPSDLAGEMGIEVVVAGSPPPAQPGLRSEYTSDPPRITLYADPISALEAAIHANQRFDMMKADLTELHIAHELFHHIEHGARFGPLAREQVETAAHAFAKELMGLDFEPEEMSEFG